MLQDRGGGDRMRSEGRIGHSAKYNQISQYYKIEGLNALATGA